ncbi:MAG: Maf family protein [Pseudomonadota bacterium]|nr:Maf family protein [Pseudomonadota bacterium]
MFIKELVLASSSPYRRKLLQSTGLTFRCQPADVDESSIHGRNAHDTAKLRARRKAEAVGRLHPQSLVLGCDQVLGFNEQNIPKARTAEVTKEHLRMLSGQQHTLYSAFALYLHHSKPPLLAIDVIPAHMRMRQLTAAEIDGFIAFDEWSETVGCYRYESTAVNLFEHVDGSQHTIVGLPLLEVLTTLRKIGINPLLAPQPPWELR